MGFQPGKRAWQRPTETGLVRGQENSLNLSDLVDRYAVQAKNYAEQNPKQAKVFMNQGFHTQITQITEAEKQISAAKALVRNEPHFIPDTIEDVDHQAAYVVALARELNKPEYNQ